MKLICPLLFLLLSGCVSIVSELSPASNCPRTIRLGSTIAVDAFGARNVEPPYTFPPGDYVLLGEGRDGLFYQAPQPHRSYAKAYFQSASDTSNAMSNRKVSVVQPYGFVVHRKNIMGGKATVEKMWVQATNVDLESVSTGTAKLLPTRVTLSMSPIQVDF